MENHSYIQKIKAFAQTTKQKQAGDKEIIPMANCGIVCCRRKQRVLRVPFLQPCLVMVLSGQKTISNGEKTDCCSHGDFLGIPAPSSFDMVNTPDACTREYLALCIPFDIHLVDRFLKLYSGRLAASHQKCALQIQGNPNLYATILHFLELADAPGQDRDVVEHRLMEILLYIVKKSVASHMVLSLSDQWSKRLTSLLLTDPAKLWRVHDACHLLAVSESTLRRNLRREKTSFQTILDDVRLGQALSQVQMTRLPVSRIAENCGYQSVSRFTERFRQRFQTTPSQLRKTMTESG